MTRKGLSLVEIVIASSIMVAAMVPLWGLLGSSHKQVTLSYDEIRVSQLAAEVIEQLELQQVYNGEYSFTPLSNGKSVFGNPGRMEIHFGEFPEYFDLRAEINIARFPATGVETGKTVQLMLSYKAKDKIGPENRNYELASFIGR